MKGIRRGRLGLAAAVAFITVATVAGVADAAVAGATSGAKDKQAELVGTSVWSSAYAISGRLDGDFGRGTYSGTLTAGSSVFTTPTCGPLCADVTGTISFTARGGRFTAEAQPGSVVAIDDIASRSFRTFTPQLRIVDGTGRYAHAAGRLSLTYASVWTHTFVDGVFVDEINDTGTLVGKAH